MKSTILFSLILMCAVVHSQEQSSLLTKQEHSKIDSLKAIDWLTYDYDYLNEDFELDISDEDFELAMGKGKFIEDRITSYSDSLSVALFKQLEDFDSVRIAKLRITYSWERLSWYLLLNSKQAQGLAGNLGFKYPYRFKEYLEDKENQSPERLALIANLRLKVAQLEQVEENVDSLDLKNLFNRAFRYSPDRLEKVRKIRESQGKK